MKARKNYPGFITALVSIALILSACNKKPDQVGLGLQPTSAELSVIFDNSTGLLAHSMVEDSVRTDANVIQTGMVGSMMDPVFGKTMAELYSQFRLSENGHDFGTDPVFDSLVLSLHYSGYYGDTLSSQTVRIYELDQDLDADSAYYSNQSVSDYGVELGSKTFIPGERDSVTVGDVKLPAQLRIPLSEEFAQKILDGSEVDFDDNEKWLLYMKGLRITVDEVAADGGIMNFDMFSANTALTIYYKSSDLEDTLSFTFLSNSACARFAKYDHNEYQDASPAFKMQVLDGDTSLGAEIFYLQGMGGVKAQLRLPDIMEFFDDGPVAINEAKLIFNIMDDGEDLDPAPKLALIMLDDEGNSVLIPDAQEPSLYYGGDINEEGTQYFFRISRHVQKILTGESPNYPLILSASGASFRAHRSILHGPDSLLNADMKMTLNVTYTQVN